MPFSVYGYAGVSPLVVSFLGQTHGEDKHTEGTNTRRDIHTERLTHGGDTHIGVTRRGAAHDMEGIDTRKDMHTEGHTHEGDTHIYADTKKPKS